jgi:predicted Zn-dependent peptidase
MKNIFYLLLAGVLFAQCSKTTTDAVMDQASDVKDQALAWRSKAPTAGPARAIQLGEYNSFTLNNGLDVIIVENHKLPRVSYQVSLKHDALIEGKEAGYTSMAGSLLTKGTESRTKAEIDQAVDFIGASLSAGGNGLFASSLTKHQDKLLEVMTDVLYNPTFPEEEFEKEKTQTLSGLATQKTDPSSMASNVASVLLYGADHPYGEIQTEETVNNMQLSTVRKYYEDYYRPNNAVLVIVGDVTPAEAKAQVEKYFADWKSKDVPSFDYPTPAAPDEAKVAFVNKDGAVQSVIRVTYPVDLKPGTDDVIASRLMNSILGGGIFSGRLMQNLREDKAYTYGARSSLRSDKLMGSFNASASVRNEVTDSSVQEFLYELNRMVKEPVSSDDISLAKASMAGQFARSLESPQTIANFARNMKLYNLPSDYYETYLQRLDATTVADVQRMAQKYIKPDNAYIVVVGNKDEVADKLVRFDGDGVLDYYDAYGNVVKYDEMAMPADLSAEKVIMDYMDALGGKDKLMSVSSMTTTATMEVMGQTAEISMKQAKPGKLAMSMGMNGMVMQETKVNGDKASVGSMGQSQMLNKGDEGFDGVAGQAKMFGGVLDYLGDDYQLDLKGIEDVDGEKAYKIVVTAPGDNKSTEFYAVKSNLLIKTVSSQEGPQGPMTVNTMPKDYKAVDGVMLPHTIETTGAAPFPMVMKVTGYEVNPSIPATEFEIK